MPPRQGKHGRGARQNTKSSVVRKQKAERGIREGTSSNKALLLISHVAKNENHDAVISHEPHLGVHRMWGTPRHKPWHQKQQLN